MTSINIQPYCLSNPIQHYLWGTRGKKAFIPNLLGITAEDDIPYAELWIGAHPKAPSTLIMNELPESLEKFVGEYPIEVLGKSAAAQYGNKFPFLLKILSAAEILSIQVHPNKSQAISLFASDPVHYLDDNHKPELAIALDSLTALIGFKNFDQICETLEYYPELVDAIGGKFIAENFQKKTPAQSLARDRAVPTFFSLLLGNDDLTKTKITHSLQALHQRLANQRSFSEEEELFNRLFGIYPEDKGLWLIHLMNLVHLKKNQGIFIGAGIPHAYIEGNIVECMAASDNVVRAGLTEKYIDTETLLKIIDFTAQPTFAQEIMDGPQILYETPAEEFQVSRISLTQESGEIRLENANPAVLLVLGGMINISWENNKIITSQEYHQGQAILIPAVLNPVWLNCAGCAELIQATVPGGSTRQAGL